jgi:hypothetical protein
VIACSGNLPNKIGFEMLNHSDRLSGDLIEEFPDMLAKKPDCIKIML